MNTKHLYDSPDGLVLKSLRGAVALHSGLSLHEPSKTVYISTPAQSPNPKQRVAVIAGGGSGHEPAHAGYTGHGMLSACIAGDIFASPSARQVGVCIEIAACGGVRGADENENEDRGGNSGAEGEGVTSGDVTGARRERKRDVLAVINNYTGDRLNFGLAIEKAKAPGATHRGLKVESVVVADDVALLPVNQTGTKTKQEKKKDLVGPRGLAANILVCKILGALAASGAPLEVVKRMGDAVVENLVSVGVGLEHCHVPGRARETGNDRGAEGEGGKDRLGAGECEIGLGLHNEPGVRRRALGPGPPEELVRELVGMLLQAGGAGAGAGGSASAGVGVSERVDGNHKQEQDRRERSNGERRGEKTFVQECRDGMVLFVNNLGGMSQLEMGALVSDTLRVFVSPQINITPKRVYAAPYMTSLNAPGFSLSVLNLEGAMRAFRASAARSVEDNAAGTDVQDGGLLRDEKDEDDQDEGDDSDPWTSTHTQQISIEALLDAPTDAYAWVGARAGWGSPERAQTQTGRDAGAAEDAAANLTPENRGTESTRMSTTTTTTTTTTTEATAERTTTTTAHHAIRTACARLIAAHAELTAFDTLVGDGDCGDTFCAGARAVLNAMDTPSSALTVALALAGKGDEEDITGIVYAIAEIVEDNMGGTIGALLAIFLHALALSLKNSETEMNNGQTWPTALRAALETLARYTPARVGDRTLVDALGPLCAAMAGAGDRDGAGADLALQEGRSVDVDVKEKEKEEGSLRKEGLARFEEAVRRAREGAERTRGMEARLGRAAYVGVGVGGGVGGGGGGGGGDGQTSALPPDPGAWGVCAVLEGLVDGIRGAD